MCIILFIKTDFIVYKISGNKLWMTYAILDNHQNGINTIKLIKNIIK